MTGCGLSSSGKSADDTAEPATKPTPKFTFTTTLKELPDSGLNFIPLLMEQDGYYAYAMEKTGEDIPESVIREAKQKGREVSNDGRYDVYEISLYYVTLDGKVAKADKYRQLPDEENAENWKYFKSVSNINGMARLDSKTLVTIEQTYVSGSSAPEKAEDYEKDRDYNEFTTNWYIRTLDSRTGRELSKSRIENADDACFDARSMKCIDKKVYCLSSGRTGNGISSINTDGSVESTALFVGDGQKLVTLNDGALAASVYKNGNYYISELNRANSSFTDIYRLPEDVEEIYDGFEDYAFFFKSSSAYFGFYTPGSRDERLVTFSSADINGGKITSDIKTRQDGSLYFIISDFDNDRYISRMAVLERTPYDETNDRKVIYIYSAAPGYCLEEAVAEFNRTGGSLRAEITDAERDADIIDLSGLDYRQKALNGELENLYPYIEKDGGLNYSDYFENVLKAAEINGKLYETVSGFTISTVLGPKDIVGNDVRWNYEDYYSALRRAGNNCAAFDVYTTREDIFRALMSVDMDWFVDYENGECNFSNDNFAELLKFAKTFPETFDASNYEWKDERDNSDLRLYNGRQLLQRVNLYCFDDACRAGFEFARPTTFIGYPTNNGVGSTISICTIDQDANFAMSSGSENKDDAWEFLRTFFTREYQKTLYYFPANREAFSERLDDYRLEYLLDDDGDIMYDRFTGEKRKRAIGTMYMSDYTEISYFGMDDGRAEEFINLVNSINKKEDLSEEIYGVICSATKEFFSGKENAWTAAARTQDMVTEWFYVSFNKN